MLDGFTRIEADLELAGLYPQGPRPAWQCDICRGIFYAMGDQPVECPYCAEDEENA